MRGEQDVTITKMNSLPSRRKLCSTKPEEVVAYARAQGIKMVDFRFVDLPGTWQHFSIPISEFDEDVFEEGLGFDGSSHPRLPEDPRERHAADPGPDHRLRRPGPGRADPRHDLRHRATR